MLTWQNDSIVYNQACKQECQSFVDEVSISKLGPAGHNWLS